MPNVKGTTLSILKAHIQSRYGEEGLRRWMEGLPAAEAQVVQGLLLPSSWYPVGAWNRGAERYVSLFGAGDPRSFRPIVEEIATTDLSSFFKLFQKMDLAAIFLRSSSVWSRYFDVGSLEAEALGPGRFLMRLTAPTGMDEGIGQISCSVAIPAWQESLIKQFGGARARSAHQACRFQGARSCEFLATWS